MTLNKRYLRNIKSNLSFYISITLLTLLVVYMYVAISAAYTKEKAYLDEKVIEANREDGQFTLYNDMSDEDIIKYEEKWNVDIEKQYFTDADLGDSRNIRVFRPSEKVNKYIISKGSDIDSDTDILISELFAKANDISIGDTIDITLNGVRKTFTVCGYAIRFDYLFCLKNVNDTFSISSEFGVGLISRDAYDSLITEASKGETYYSVVFNEDNEQEVRKDLYAEYQTSSYTSADINNRIQTPNDQLEELGTMTGMILPVAIIFVVILMAVILGRKVKNEKKMIGILNALGMTKFELARHYSIFGLIPGLVGSVLGTILGNATTGYMMDLMIEGKLEPFNIKFDGKLSSNLIAIGLPTLCYTLAVFVTALITIKGNSIELIKGSGKSNVHKNLRFPKSKMSFKTKYKLRAVLGNYGRTLTLIIGLAIGGLVLAFMLACTDSLEYYVDKSVDEIGSFEYEYFLNQVIVEAEDNSSFEADAVGFLASSFAAEDKNDIVTVMGIDDTSYINLTEKSGSELTPSDDHFYISSMGSMLYGVKKGDTLKLYDINSLEEYSITIDGVFENGSQNLIITNNKTLCKLLSLDTTIGIPLDSVKIYNGVMSKDSISFDDGLVLKEIYREDIKKQLDENILDSMKDILWVVLLLGAGIMIMIIFLMVNVLLSENTVTISMLKVLGYNDNEINSIITHVYHGIVAIGIIMGFFLGIWANDLNFKKSASVYNCYVKNVVKPSSVMIYFGIAIASYIISLKLLGNKIKKVSMVESLKDTRA